MRLIKSLWRLPIYAQYAVPLIGACLIVLLHSGIGAFDNQPFALTGAVVAITALVGGLGPGLFGSALMIILGLGYQLRSAHGVLSSEGAINIVAMAFVLITVSIVIHTMRVVIQAHDETMARFNSERDKLAFLVDSLHHGFIIVDRSWRLTFANKALLAMYGKSAEQLTGVLLWDLVGGQFHEFEREVESARETGREVRQELTSNGRVYDVRAIPHGDETLIYAQDLTERRRMETQKSALLELESEARHKAELEARVKDDFLLTISHELRTPLTTIMGWTEIIGSDPSASTVKSGAEAILRSAKSQEHMVGQLLDLASINSGRFALSTEVFELDEAITESLRNVELDAQERGHVLEVATHTKPLLVRGDLDQIAKAFTIVLDNGLRYTPTPGHIRLTTSQEDSTAILEIEDNGKGVEADFLPHMFDRFRQSERTMIRTYNGLGLGLTIAKAIIELHGGRIEAVSRGPSEGTLMRIRLPVSDTTTLPTIRTNWEGCAPIETLLSLRILLVDDDQGTREVLGQFLGSEGATVTVASSGIEALARALVEPIDVIVSDIGMPGMSGLELIERLRSDPKTSAIRALALSAYQDADVVRLCHEAGYDSFATKPIGRTELLEKISELSRIQ